MPHFSGVRLTVAAIFEFSNLKSRNAEACFGKVNVFVMSFSVR
ncbi:hypothetical protein T03_17832 [Trichinella britovi]|uniref:Uncharacterized protein n=1 Tax=Trichinella britovi TaxID=45882 RepID=A0A0V1C3C7_TRIBR|nr:hypothetical protein T03_17832 [Trichinella britovi]